jgi:hypothetical protein
VKQLTPQAKVTIQDANHQNTRQNCAFRPLNYFRRCICPRAKKAHTVIDAYATSMARAFTRKSPRIAAATDDLVL